MVVQHKLTNLTAVITSKGTPVKSKLVGHAADGQRHHQSRNGSGGPTCNYYKRRGHVISECWTLEQKRNTLFSDLLVSAVNLPTTYIITPVENSDETSSLTDYHPFVSEGSVCVPVKEWRNRCSEIFM